MPLYIKYPEWLKPEIFPGLPFRWYGLMYIVAFAVAYYFYRKQVRERGYPLSEDNLTSLFFWGILGLILGARLFSVIIYESSRIYQREPWLVFWPFRNGRFTGLQGMSYHGGVIGCISGFLLWSIVKKHDVRDIADMFGGSIPAGYTFGRIGNFINAELYGRATVSPAGMLFPHAETLPLSQDWVAKIAEQTGITVSGQTMMVNLPRHPSQLYEAFFEGIFLWAVIWLIRKKSPFKGFCAGLYIAGYGLIRFVIEYFRQPDSDLGYRIQFAPNDLPLAYAHPLTSLSTGQLLCLGMVAAGGLIWFVSARVPGSAFSYVLKPPVEGSTAPESAAAGGTGNALRNKRKNQRKKLK
ncbi:MAG: prolipoprotein diacylglyceryl transferase [Spirochaetaceae bacterium]|jgi:phosphatidylglycerol:prolipoprotein diacylglycerol transferase|nr:prolipoprotein diacylglyceryl transferase [Spirochaetaceae bacterium]